MYESLFRHKAGGEEGPLAYPGSDLGEPSRPQGDEPSRQAGLPPFSYQDHSAPPHAALYEGDTDKSVGNIRIPA